MPVTSLPPKSLTLLTLAMGVLIVLLVATHWPSPPLDSRCGRLVHVPPGPGSLSLNHTSLALPVGTAWTHTDLAYSLEAGEVLAFVADRLADDMVVVRVSRDSEFNDALIVYHGGAAVETQPLAAGRPSGRLDFDWNGRSLAIRRDGEQWVSYHAPTDPSHPDFQGSTSFEVVMWPPDAAVVHERVKLGKVMLTVGAPLEPPWTVPPWLSVSLIITAAAIVGYLQWPLLRRLPAMLFPFQTRHYPRHVGVLLLCMGVTLVGLALLKANVRLFLFSPQERFVRRSWIAFIVFWSIGLGILRDRWLAARSRRGRGTPIPLALVPAAYVGGLIAAFVASFGLFSAVNIQWDAFPRGRYDAFAPGPRIVCLGGSVTRGYPFFDPTDDALAYPRVLERRLRAAGLPATTVANRGVDGATIFLLAANLRSHLVELRPTHVVVTSVVNMPRPIRWGQQPKYRQGLEEVVAACDSGVEGILFVKEPTLRAVREVALAASGATAPQVDEDEAYAMLDEFAKGRARVSVVDPLPDFAAHRDEFLFMDNVHLTKRGHEVLAEVIARAFVAPLSRASGPH